MSVLRWLVALPRRALALVVFLVVFTGQMVLANLRVAAEVVTPGLAMRAAIVRVPTRARSPLEVSVLANVITMTPGTLTIEVDPDTYELYVHGLYVDDLDELRATIARTEDRLLRFLR